MRISQGPPSCPTAVLAALLHGATAAFLPLCLFLSVLCIKSTEAIGIIRDGELRTATSTFTQPLSSVLHSLFFFFFSVALRLHRPYGLLGTESPGRPPRLSTQLLCSKQIPSCPPLSSSNHRCRSPLLQNDQTLAGAVPQPVTPLCMYGNG